MSKLDKMNKTIKLAIYFWTNISDKDKYGEIEFPKKTCWDSGFVGSVANNLHGIRSGTTKSFGNIEELSQAINEVIKKSGITLVDSRKDKEYKEALKKIKEAKLTID